MRLNKKLLLSTALSTALISVPFSGAQQKITPATRTAGPYDLSREVTLVGTVVSYTANSSGAPAGPHVMVQTSSGNVDVHLGSAELLEFHRLTLNAGDSVRIIGESLPYGGSTMFAARIIQKGLQAVAVRNTKGFVVNMPAVHVAGGVR